MYSLRSSYGKTAFFGHSVQEVLLKHSVEEPIPVDRVDSTIPIEVSEICSKMLVKDAANRYQNMDEVIAAAESYLSLAGGGKFKPTEEHLQKLEECVERFNSAPAARLRKRLIQGFSVLCLLGGIAGGFIDVSITTVLLSTFLNAVLAYFIISGLRQKTYLFRKSRRDVWQPTYGLADLRFRRRIVSRSPVLSRFAVGLAARCCAWSHVRSCVGVSHRSKSRSTTPIVSRRCPAHVQTHEAPRVRGRCVARVRGELFRVELGRVLRSLIRL